MRRGLPFHEKASAKWDGFEVLSEGPKEDTMADYVLYLKPTCPYCRKVLSFMQRAGIDLPQRNTLEPGVRDELIAIGGKGQVPCLVIDGEALYESDDIIAYLRERLA
jgi:glutaredoxin